MLDVKWIISVANVSCAFTSAKRKFLPGYHQDLILTTLKVWGIVLVIWVTVWVETLIKHNLFKRGLWGFRHQQKHRSCKRRKKSLIPFRVHKELSLLISQKLHDFLFLRKLKNHRHTSYWDLDQQISIAANSILSRTIHPFIRKVELWLENFCNKSHNIHDLWLAPVEQYGLKHCWLSRKGKRWLSLCVIMLQTNHVPLDLFTRQASTCS